MFSPSNIIFINTCDYPDSNTHLSFDDFAAALFVLPAMFQKINFGHGQPSSFNVRRTASYTLPASLRSIPADAFENIVRSA